MGELQTEPFQFAFHGFLKVAFQGSRITSDAGLILIRELDERLGLATLIAEHLSDSRQGLNTQFGLVNLLRQSVYTGISDLPAPSLQQRLVKTGGRLVKHARYYWLLLAEGHLTRRLFGDMLRRIWALPVPAG